ncbi:hypothetical protein MKW94_011715 [Papaver nudicaule]|uniref:Uncharacterized protein n=1 Tax=Papaver nudicaule TaxID=74823 RepID=A0AA41S9U8_PAPNU|nr:hypothetical protein [Papaver nudicaule]
MRNMPSGSYEGGVSEPWQNGPRVLEARGVVKELLKNILKVFPGGSTINDSTIDVLNDILMWNANSMREYMDPNTLSDRIASINNGRCEPQTFPSSSEHYYFNDWLSSPDCFMDSTNDNYCGESSQMAHLQPDGMFSNAGTTTTLQHQPQNNSLFEVDPLSFTMRSYSASQMPNFSGGNTHIAAQNGNYVDFYAPSGFRGASLEAFDQAYQNQGGLNYNFPVGTSQGSLQGTIQYAPPNSALQPSYLYAPTGQPSMDQRSYETGMTSRQQPLHQTRKRRAGRSLWKEVSAGCNYQATVCGSGCEYCGKHPLLVEFFLKRNEKSFRHLYPKLCEKMDYLSQHLEKCNNQSCGCSIYRPYYQHSDCLHINGFKKRQVSRKVAPHSLNLVRSTREVRDGGDDGQFPRKYTRINDGSGPLCASVDQLTSQVGVSQMGTFNETVVEKSITSWDWGWSALPAHDNGNSYSDQMSVDDHAQGLKTMRHKPDGASQTESPSSVQTPHSGITQESDEDTIRAMSALLDCELGPYC